MPQELKVTVNESKMAQKQRILKENIESQESQIMTGIRIYIWRLGAVNNRNQVGELAKEIMQETVAKALQIADKFNPDLSADKWLLGIAIKEIQQYKRTKHLQTRFIVPVRDTALAQSASSKGAIMTEDEMYDLFYHSETQLYTMEEILSVVNESERQVLRLHFIEGLSGEELAAALGTALGTAYTRLSRAKNHLRQQFTNF